MPRTKSTAPKRNIWTDTTSKYGTYEGQAGNPAQWAAAFKTAKMTRDQALGILKEGESPYEVLGIPETATVNEIRKAMAGLVLKYRQDSFSHDKAGSDANREMFDKVMAAYTLLTIK